MTAENSTEPLTDQETDQESLEEAIRRRAYEISVSADAGTPEENWARAEHELDPQG